jgi:hypothetical protein
MRKGCLLGVVLVCFLALLAAPARAQGEMHRRVYTYVSEWAVPRAMWPEMAKDQAADQAFLDKFLADGTITSYGDFVNLVHQEGEPTHGGWFQSNTISGILRVLAAYAAQPGVTAPVLAASKHWDLFLESDADQIGGRAGTYRDAYLHVLSFRVKRGQQERFEKLYKTYLQPIYRELMSDGTLLYYATDGQYVNSEAPGAVDVVSITANADAMDKTSAAFGAAFAKNPAALQALQESVDAKSFRSFLSIVPFMKAK